MIATAASISSDVLVSVIMANHDCAPWIEAAIASALAQTVESIEVIVADDMSKDDSVAVVGRLAAADPRIRLIEAERNGGPGAARNRALAAARGRWIAVLDSDDLIHPDRIRRLIAAAERDGSDMVADDLLIFDDLRRARAVPLLWGDWARRPFDLDPQTWVRANGLYERLPVLGYLKPVFRASLFADGGFRYDEDLRIAEDYDLVLRLLAAGHSFRVHPELGYFYRKRSTSISHRLSAATIDAMRRGDARFRAEHPNRSVALTAALDRRLATVDRARAFDDLVDGLKRRSPAAVIRTVAATPSCVTLMRLPIAARLARIVHRLRRAAPGVPDDGRNLAFVTRQRIVGRSNGSSTYALGILDVLAAAGWRIHYLCPSPTVFGSRPWLKLSPDTDVFASISIRGGLRLGHHVIATDPRVALRAIGRTIEALAMRFGCLRRPILGPAPYAIACPLVRADRLYLADHLPARADRLLFDYAFLTETRPYALRPRAAALVLMHDLFSSRSDQFAGVGAADSVATLDFDSEIEMLGGADEVVAIQHDEAATVGAVLGAGRVITAPMAVDCWSAAEAGEDDRLLFVGSATAPNVDAMQWFLAEVWPRVKAARPAAVLDIVGDVGRTLGTPPAGVKLLGLVPDLDPLYRRAGVVISPLRVGSGLKIKLIEALSRGKACVVSSTTCQGVSALVGDAVVVADSAERQAAAIADLLADRSARQRLAEAALAVARDRFGTEACYGGIVAFYGIPGSAPA